MFIDTLGDLKLTRQFGERYGSYPVLRIIDPRGLDRARRIDGNPVGGNIPVSQILHQFGEPKP